MKRLTTLIFAILLITTVTITTNATSIDQQEAAERLYSMELFQGFGIDNLNQPIFALDKIPTRAQATIMLVRLLDKEEEAKAEVYPTPFTDIEDSLKPYIGHAYKNGLANGTTSTTYSPKNSITAPQYLTFVLRALGYNSTTDFTVGTACTFAQSIGLTNGEYTNETTNFNRGDVAQISYKALSTIKKDGTISVKPLNYENFHKMLNISFEERESLNFTTVIATLKNKYPQKNFAKSWAYLGENTQKQYLDNLLQEYSKDNINHNWVISVNYNNNPLSMLGEIRMTDACDGIIYRIGRINFAAISD